MHRDLWICFSIFILLRDSGTNKVLFSRTVSDRYLLRFVHLLAFFTFYVFLYLCVPTGASPGLFLPKTMTFQHFLKKTKKRASEQMSMVDQNALNQKRKETVENRNPEYLTVFTKTHSNLLESGGIRSLSVFQKWKGAFSDRVFFFYKKTMILKEH